MEIRAGDHFSDSYPRTRPNHYWRPKNCAWIEARLASWNCGSFKELVCDSYVAATGYLSRARRNQNSEQLHSTLLNLVLHRKLCEAVRFFCKRESGGFLQPNKRASDKMGVMEESIVKYPHPPPFHLLYSGGVWINTYLHSCGHYQGCDQIGRTETFREFGTRSYGLRISTRVDFKFGEDEKKLRTSIYFFLIGWPIRSRPG